MEIIILASVFVVSALLGLFVFHNNPRSITNRLFFILSILLAIWSAVIYISLHPPTVESTILWVRLTTFFAVPMVISFLLLVHFIPRERIQLSSKGLNLLIILIGLTLLTMFVCISPYLFTDVVFSGNTYSPIPGPGMLLFAPVINGAAILAIIILIKRFRKAAGIEKRQLGYMLLGITLMFGFIIITIFLPVALFQKITFVSLGPLYALIFLFTTAYAIVKHRMMDIRAVVARTVSFTLLILFFGIFYSLFFGILSSLFINFSSEIRPIIISTVLALIMAFSFQYVRRFLEKITDKILYKDYYDSNHVLYNLALIMASTLRLEDLTHGILNEILQQVRISKGAFILLDEVGVFDVKSEGYKVNPTLDEEEIKEVGLSRKTLIFHEMEESSQKEILRKLDLSIISPLRTEGKLVGLLALGEKESGDIFSEQDLNLIEILAPEAAVAIQNANAYEEIRRFNITLQEEVNHATKDLKTANEKLQDLDKLKDEFVSLASHELRTPMTAIKGSLSTILEGYAGEISKESREFLAAAYNENDRLIRLVNNLLNISRIEAGRFKFTVTKVNMKDVIGEVVHNLEMAASEKQLYLKADVPQELPLVFADEDKVKEVLINFIGNALKFTHKGGVTIKSTVKDLVVITSVTDTGSGIAKEDQDLLFKKFSQVEGNYAKQTGGTGLGLYISKQIIEGLQGKVWLESELGKGSSFCFSLPIVK